MNLSSSRVCKNSAFLIRSDLWADLEGERRRDGEGGRERRVEGEREGEKERGGEIEKEGAKEKGGREREQKDGEEEREREITCSISLKPLLMCVITMKSS